MPRLSDDLINFYRNTKGLPLTVLELIFQLGGRAGNKELIDITQSSDKTLAKALERLRALGYIEQRVRFNGWCLTTEGRQLPLFDSSRKFYVSQLSSRNISDSQPSSSSLLSLTSLLILIKNLTTTTIGSSRNISDSPEMDAYLSSKGVWPNQRGIIAEALSNSLPLAEKYFEHLDTPLAIHRIKKSLPPPTEAEIKKLNKKEADRSPAHYAQGEYAHLINRYEDEDQEAVP